MRLRMNVLLIALVILISGRAGAPAFSPHASPPGDVPENFDKVSDGVYRSGQPDRKQFGALVKTCGVKSVLNLRLNHHDDDEAEGLPLRLYTIPMRAGNIQYAQIVEAMVVLRDSPKPILVHCWHGSDRTGCIVALYRMVFEGWPKGKAIREFKSPRFGHHEDIYPNIDRFLRELDVAKLKGEVLPKKTP